jgi:hypothetical protein
MPTNEELRDNTKELYKVVRIESFHTYDWLLKKHYAHRIPSISFSFGLYDIERRLQGICTFGKPASPSLCEGICGKEFSPMVYELNRLCINDGLGENILSFFVGKCLTFFRTGFIFVSYADTEYGHHGYIYQATNWLYTGVTKERTDIGNEDGTHGRHYDKTIDKTVNRKHRSAKHRYVFFAGTKRNRELLRSHLKYPILPYPKGDNKRYDASYTPPTQAVLI